MTVPQFLLGATNAALAEATSLSAARFGLRNGYVLELMDLNEPPTVIQTFVFPVPPAIYDRTDPFTAVLTPGEGPVVVSEEYGVIISEIRLEGTFGVSKKRVSGFEGAVNGGNDIEGSQHFALLAQLFKTYSDRKKDPVLGPNTQLVFHSLKEDDHLIVVPRSFARPRDAKVNRLHYTYKIQLSAIGYADDVQARTVSDDVDNVFDNAIETISKGLNDARAAFTDVNLALLQVRQKIGNIQAIMTQTANLITAVGTSIKNGADVIQFPFQLAQFTAEQLGTAADDLAVTLANTLVDVLSIPVRDLRKLENAIHLMLAFPDRFVEVASKRFTDLYAGERRLTQQDVEDGTAGARPGSRTRVAYGTEGNAGLDLSRYTSVRAVTVDRSTTLTGLSARYDVPAALILLINDLRPPYFAEGGGPGVLGPGDTVLVPTISNGQSRALAPVNTGYLTADEVLYGRDLALDMSVFRTEKVFDLRVDTAHGGLDAEIVGGIPNVVQGVQISVETERGTTVYIPDLGIRRTAGKKGTLNNVILASLYLREAMLFDPRIAKILQLVVTQNGDVLQQNVSVELEGGRSNVSFVRPFGRASGGS